MSKTLSESAAEILNASMKAAGKEPLNKNSQYTDIGGATPFDDYSTKLQSGQGDEDESVGVNAAKLVGVAPKPGQQKTPADDKKGNPKSVGLAKPQVGSMDNKLQGEEVDVDDEDLIEEDFDDEDEEEEELSEEEIAAARKEIIKELMNKHKGSMVEDVNALFNGESLSEDFRMKATMIFEAAVSSRVEAIVENILKDNDEVLEESIEAIQMDLAEKVDQYMDYVVENWMQENELAVESGLRAELTEDFISGLKNLFQEHYIDIPEEKADVAEELAERLIDLEESMTQRELEVASLTEELNEAKKKEAIRKACSGLTETQIAKLTSLAESVEFTTEGDFNTKLAVIRENYFQTKPTVTNEIKAIQETSEDQPEVEIPYSMHNYVQAITKSLPK